MIDGMIRMTRGGVWLRRAGLLVALGALVACGSGEQSVLTSLGRSVSDGILDRGDGAAPRTPEQVRASLTPAALAQLGRPVMVVTVEQRNAATVMIEITSSGPSQRWRDGGNTELTLTGNGVLQATRGIGNDLMSADVAETANALSRGQSGALSRTHLYVDGDWQTVTRPIPCVLSGGEPMTTAIGGRNQSVRRVVEDCRVGDQMIQNVYWVRSGEVLRSRQWAGPEIGYLGTEIFRP
jgi:hypothetical protein